MVFLSEETSASVGGIFRGLLRGNEIGMLFSQPAHATVDPKVQRAKETAGSFIEKHLHTQWVMFVLKQCDGLSDQPRRCLEERAIKTDGAVFVDLPSDGDAEIIAKVTRSWSESFQVVKIAFQRCLAG